MLGEIVDDDGRGIGGAGVVVVIGEHTVARATADLDGHFSLELPNDAVDAAVFGAPGYTEVRVAGAALPTMAEAFWSQTLNRAPGSRVLTVVSGGVPVFGATVFRVEKATPSPLGTTDDNGHVVLPTGPGDLVVAHLAHGAVDVGSGSGSDIVTLPASALVRIVVVDEDRHPLADAMVNLRSVPMAPTPTTDGLPAVPSPTTWALRLLQRRERPRVSDEGGVVSWLTMVGDVTVDVRKDGFRPVTGVRDRARVDRATDVVVKLGTSPMMAGVVVDAVTGAPIAGAAVGGDVRGAGGLETRTDEEGRFTLGQWEARASSLTVAARGYRTVTVGGVDGSSSRLDDVRIELVPGSGDTVVGIGVSIVNDPRGLRVRSLEPGSPAESAGVAVGDIIVTVDGSSVSSNLDAAVGSIRGSPGTSVQIGIEGEDGARRQLTVPRAAITVRKPGRHR
jgi:hypothetical protein